MYISPLVLVTVQFIFNKQLKIPFPSSLTNVKMNVAALIISAVLLSTVEIFGYANADCPTIITRSQWGARSPTGTITGLSQTPAPFVVIHHAASAPCTNQAVCQAKIRGFQEDHMNRREWSDIGYNFLVGEDGNVYEGRGWDKRGAHTVPYNSKSIGICFIGNFTNRQPSTAAVNAAKRLIQCGVELGKITSSYGLLGHQQAAQTNCPGRQLFDLLKTWPHWLANPTQ